MRPRLVAITPGDDRAVRVRVAAVRAGGADVVVLREPRLYPTLAGPGVLLHGRTPGAIDAAVRLGCGLHLPASIAAAPLRAQIRGSLSQSCHDRASLAAAAAAGCDFAFLSPVFSPTSKPADDRRVLGLAGLAVLCRTAALPVVALGGIGPGRVRGCLEAGAAGVAGIGAFFPPGADGVTIRRAVAEMRKEFGDGADGYRRWDKDRLWTSS